LIVRFLPVVIQLVIVKSHNGPSAEVRGRQLYGQPRGLPWPPSMARRNCATALMGAPELLDSPTRVDKGAWFSCGYRSSGIDSRQAAL